MNKIISKSWANDLGAYKAYTDGSSIFFDAQNNTTTAIDIFGDAEVTTGRVGI